MTVIIPPKTRKTDEFAVANKNGLTHPGYTWYQPDANNPRIENQTASDPTGFVTGYWPALLTDNPAATDTHYASAFVAETAMTAQSTGLIVGSDALLSNYAWCAVATNNVWIGYGTGPASAETFAWVSKGSTPSAIAAGTAIRFEKHVAANGAMYRVWVNSTLELEYTDNALTVPNGPNNRCCGLFVRRSGFSGSANWDSFTVADLYPS